MIYGYSKKVVDEEYGLLEMREVSFAMNPAQLRLVADFLSQVAEQIESGKTFLHLHIDEMIPEWRASPQEPDIVVLSSVSMVDLETDKDMHGQGSVES